MPAALAAVELAADSTSASSDDFEEGLVQCTTCRSHLLGHRLTAGILLDHPLDTAQLAFNPAQAGDHALLVLRLLGARLRRRLFSGHDLLRYGHG